MLPGQRQPRQNTGRTQSTLEGGFLAEKAALSSHVPRRRILEEKKRCQSQVNIYSVVGEVGSIGFRQQEEEGEVYIGCVSLEVVG